MKPPSLPRKLIEEIAEHLFEFGEYIVLVDELGKNLAISKEDFINWFSEVGNVQT